jgi:Bacterial capsule synthesis protein PGA_cap
MDVPASQRIVAEAARRNDYVIVCLHGGGEGVNYMHTPDSFEYFLGWPRGNVVKFARAVVDSGADLVWGHGPHVPRALELYRGRLIAYSLGNFCTWAGFNIDAERSYAPILYAVLDSSGAFVSGRIHSCVQKPGEYLKLDTLRRAARLMAKLTAEDFPNSGPRITDDGEIIIKQ